MPKETITTIIRDAVGRVLRGNTRTPLPVSVIRDQAIQIILNNKQVKKSDDMDKALPINSFRYVLNEAVIKEQVDKLTIDDLLCYILSEPKEKKTNSVRGVSKTKTEGKLTMSPEITAAIIITAIFTLYSDTITSITFEDIYKGVVEVPIVKNFIPGISIADVKEILESLVADNRLQKKVVNNYFFYDIVSNIEVKDIITKPSSNKEVDKGVNTRIMQGVNIVFSGVAFGVVCDPKTQRIIIGRDDLVGSIFIDVKDLVLNKPVC